MDVEAALDGTRRYLSQEPFSGTVRLTRGNDVLLEHASGLANRADSVPIGIDTRFGTASLTKTFTATAVGRLVDAGRLAFEARIVDVVAPERRPSTLGPDVTVHHLLTHTSGIADYFDEERLGAAAYEQIWLEHPSYTFRRPADFLPLFGDLPPVRAPGGADAHYCNAGYVLLALVIEDVSGEEYATFVEREVFAAAGMNDSAFLAMDEVHERVAVGYIEEPGRVVHTNHYAIPVVGGGDGGAFTTTPDLCSFLDALDDASLLSGTTWDTMRTPHVSLEGLAYGYGVILGPPGRRPESWGGAGADPGYSARAFRYPGLGLDVAMLGNTIDETDGPMRAIRDALAEAAAND